MKNVILPLQKDDVGKDQRERKEPVSGGEVVEKNKHFKLSHLTAWTRVHSIAKRHVRVRSRWLLLTP